jgi:hypothetical protein
VQQNLALPTRIEEGPRKCAAARAGGAVAPRTMGKSGGTKVDQGRSYRLGVPVSQLSNAELDALIAEGGDDEDWDDEDDEPSEEEAWRYWEMPRTRGIVRSPGPVATSACRRSLFPLRQVGRPPRDRAGPTSRSMIGPRDFGQREHSARHLPLRCPGHRVRAPGAGAFHRASLT